jgi:hypothetical protein
MATDLNAGFTNNINTIAIRGAGTVVQRYTDRAIDIDGDGAVETVSIVTTPRGQKVSDVVTIPAGVARTLIDQTNETDGGVNTEGEEFTEGVE